MIQLVFVGAIMVLTAQATPRDTPQLRVDVPAELRCPDEDAALTALRRRLGQGRIVRGRAAASDLGLRLSARGPRGVSMVLRRGATVVVERTVAAREGECAALAETLALMAESWLTPGPPAARRSPERLPVPSESADPAPPRHVEPTPSAADGASEPATATGGPAGATADPAVDGTATAASEQSSPTDAADPAAASPPSAPPPVRTEVAPPRPSPVELPVAAPASASGRPWTATLAADAGAMVSLDARTALTASGRADFSVDYHRWRLGVRGAFENRADIDPSAGEVMVRHIHVGAYLGRRLAESDHAVVTAVAGAALDFVSAQVSGYANGRTTSATEPLVLVGVQGEWRVSRRIGVIAATDLIVALRRERFTIANVGPVTTTSRLRAGLALGVAWHLR